MLIYFDNTGSKIFTMFKCKSIDGIDDGQLLMEDYTQTCASGEHVTYQLLGIVFLCVYVIGIPFGMFLILWRNKKHLHDEASPKHHLIKNALGGMYTQYEPKYWWFEIFLLINKTMMCGGLVMFRPGTSIQVLVATLIMLVHLLVVLKLSPFESNGEDYSSFLSSFTLTLTTLGGFALMTDNPKPGEAKSFDSDALAYVLVGISIACIVSQIAITILIDCGIWARITNKKRSSSGDSDGGTTKVVPASEVQRKIETNAQNAWSTNQ